MPAVTPQIGLLGIILFLLPGLMGIRAYFRASKKADPLSRTETVAWSFLLSLSSMLLLYVIYSVKYPGFPTVANLQREIHTLPSAIGHYLGVLTLSVATGWAYGKDIDNNEDEVRSRRDLWEYYLEEIIGETDDYIVRVVTSQGERVIGRLTKYGSSSQDRDVVLDKPKTQLVTESGRKVEIENWTGKAYIQGNEIEQVHFDSLWDADQIQLQEEGADEDEQEERNEAMATLEDLAGSDQAQESGT